MGEENDNTKSECVIISDVELPATLREGVPIETVN